MAKAFVSGFSTGVSESITAGFSKRGLAMIGSGVCWGATVNSLHDLRTNGPQAAKPHAVSGAISGGFVGFCLAIDAVTKTRAPVLNSFVTTSALALLYYGLYLRKEHKRRTGPYEGDQHEE